MDDTWLEGHERARKSDAAHDYSDKLDWTTISPTIDWAGGGLVTTVDDLCPLRPRPVGSMDCPKRGAAAAHIGPP
jgi:hypothetical protein